MTSSQHPLEHLKYSTWITSGARFNAEQRIRRQYATQLWSIACLSALAICVNILPLFTAPSNPVSFANRCNFISTVISIVIISISFYTANSNSIKYADMLHQCAKSIKLINKEICFYIESGSAYDFNDLKNRYDNAMETCSINHKPCDYMLFCAENSNDVDILKKHQNIINEKTVHKRIYIAACYSPIIFSVALLLFLSIPALILPFSQN